MKKFLRVCAWLVTFSLVMGSWTTYATSSKYENTHVNTGDQAADIVAVALTQVGYCEGNSSSQVDGTVAGSKNYTKYGAWYGYQAAWCGMFVSWCADQAGISTSTVPRSGAVSSFLSFYDKMDRYYKARSGYEPKPGDLILFSWKHSSSSAEHIGLVIRYDSETEKVWFVDGNYSNKVNYRSLHYQHADIQSYCSPKYSNTAPETTPASSPTATGSPSPTEKPTEAPTAKPTATPTASPSPSPTKKPTAKPTVTPKPTVKPTATAKPTPEPVSLTGIEVVQEPFLTMYPEGMPLDKSGLLVEAIYSDGSRKEISDYTLSGYRSDTIGKKAVTVTYKGYKTVLFVTIVPRESSESDDMDDLERIEGLVKPNSDELHAYLNMSDALIPDMMKLWPYIQGSTAGASTFQTENIPGRPPQDGTVFE